MDGLFGGIVIVVLIFAVMFILSHLDEKRYNKEKSNANIVREVVRSFDDEHEWKTLTMKDALLAGVSIEHVDVENNKVFLKTPDGLVEAKVNASNLRGFLVKIKAFPKSIYQYTDIYINLDMNNHNVVIDSINYSE